MARFLSWLGEVICGLAAYTLSRWLWQKQGDGVFANLWQELATFSVLFVLLRLIVKGMELARQRKKKERAVLKAAARIEKR